MDDCHSLIGIIGESLRTVPTSFSSPEPFSFGHSLKIGSGFRDVLARDEPTRTYCVKKKK
jgi:hypothetical protein